MVRATASPATLQLYTRNEIIDQIKAMMGGRRMTQCAEDWKVNIKELSKVLLGKQYPGPVLRGLLGVEEEVVWRRVKG